MRTEDMTRNLILAHPEFAFTCLWSQLNDRTGLPPFISLDERPPATELLNSHKVFKREFL